MTRNRQNSRPPPNQPMINKIERDAIEFAQSLLAAPNKGEADSLSKIEREAISYAKNLLKMFGKS